MAGKRIAQGFTLVEVLVVIAIISIMATVSALTFQNMNKKSSLRAGGSELYDALVSARANTLASQGDTVYGVHVGTSTITRFVGSTYTSGSATNRVYTFAGDVSATSSLITSGMDVVFERLTGASNASGTVYVRENTGAGTTTILIHATGLVEYD